MLRRYELTDEEWNCIAPLLPPENSGKQGRPQKCSRTILNGIVWIARSGAPWRDLPPEYGGWENTHRRFCRWRDKGTWEHVLANLMDMPDFEWLMIDSLLQGTCPYSRGKRR